jgi:hypothetical protein
MIRRLPVLFAALLFVSGAFAQSRITATSRFGSPSGFGSILYPGVGHAPIVRLPGAITDTTFAGRLGRSVSGFPPYTGVSRGYGRSGYGAYGRGRQMIVPVPVFIGGGYYPYDVPPPGYYQEPVQVPVPIQQQSATPPVVIINQGFRPDTASPVVRQYGTENETEPQTIRRYEAPVHPMPDPKDQAKQTSEVREDQATIYLIAFKDHTILPALAYWVEGDTLNYITTQGTPNRASLTLIDREFSRQLNRERQVEFNLP